MKPIILLGAASALALCASAEAAPTPRVAPFEQPFAVGMNVGDDDIVVGRNGPLEAVARCFPRRPLLVCRARA